MTKGEPHIDYTKFDTIKIGNEIAFKIIANEPRRPNYSATLRHAFAIRGTEYAVALACDLLGIDYQEARAVIARLSTSKTDDFVWSHEHHNSE